MWVRNVVVVALFQLLLLVHFVHVNCHRKNRLRGLVEPLKAAFKNGCVDHANVVAHGVDGFARKLADVGGEG